MSAPTPSNAPGMPLAESGTDMFTVPVYSENSVPFVTNTCMLSGPEKVAVNRYSGNAAKVPHAVSGSKSCMLRDFQRGLKPPVKSAALKLRNPWSIISDVVRFRLSVRMRPCTVPRVHSSHGEFSLESMSSSVGASISTRRTVTAFAETAKAMASVASRIFFMIGKVVGENVTGSDSRQWLHIGNGGIFGAVPILT